MNTAHIINWPRGTARDWGCVIATDVSVGRGLLDGLWKGAREGENGIDSTHAPAWRFPPLLPIP